MRHQHVAFQYLPVAGGGGIMKKHIGMVNANALILL